VFRINCTVYKVFFVSFAICVETRVEQIPGTMAHIIFFGPLQYATCFMGAVLKIGRSLVRSQLCHWNFSLTKSFRSHYGPGVDSTYDRNEYQKHFLGVKAAGA